MEENMKDEINIINETIELLESYIKEDKPTKKEFIAKGTEHIEKLKDKFANMITPPSDYSIFCAELDRRFEGLLYSRFL